MKRLIIAVISIGLSLSLGHGIEFYLGTTDKDIKQAGETLKKEGTENIKTNITDPLRAGTKAAAGDIEEVKKPTITTQNGATTALLDQIKMYINIALALFSFIAFLYLLYNGFLAVTANGDEGKFKKAIGSVRFATISIIGVGISRILVLFIFSLINSSTANV